MLKNLIALLSKPAEQHFQNRQKVDAAISALEAKIKALKKERNQLDATLKERWFAVDEPHRLRDGTVVVLRLVEVEPVVVTPDMVGKTIRQGYSYNRFEVQAG